ncbi:MAG: hypothetical protein KC441_05265, partial [Anaerolineales bacterium]|nr:hypothetical protein [Anaerolineales bacterium]
PSPSPDLLAANERLLALRRALRRAGSPDQPETDVPGVACPDAADAAPALVPCPSHDPLSTFIDSLPSHLGWESMAVTTHLRQTAKTGEQPPIGGLRSIVDEEAALVVPPLESEENQLSLPIPNSALATHHATLSLPPALGLALLQQGRVAEGRLWLLLRVYDTDDRGWWARAEMTAVFTEASSPACFCSPRYLRQLLARGEGLFWRQDAAGKVWLRSQAKVAAGLGLRRLPGRAAQLPTSVLLGPIGDLRAHLYAAFHSSRGEDAAPISRESLRDLSGASPRTQQAYEKRAKVRVQPCLAVGGVAGTATASSAALQEDAWQHGRAAFTFHDRRGRHGRPGQTMPARRLPNRYAGPHPTGRRSRRLNRRLAGLCHQGDAGNGRGGRCADDRRAAKRRYYPDGAAAARDWVRDGGQTWVYWPGRGAAGSGVGFWYSLPGDGRKPA